MIAFAVHSLDEPFSIRGFPPIVHHLHDLARRITGQIIVRSPMVMPGASAEPGSITYELVVRGFIRVRSPTAILRVHARAVCPSVAPHHRRA